MASRKWPYTLWKEQGIANALGNPIIPYLNTAAMTLASNTGYSLSSVTVVRTMYWLTLAGTITLTSGGKTNTTPAWWADLAPAFSIDARPASSAPGHNPWPAGDQPTHAQASGGLDVSYLASAVDNATGLPTQTVLFQASGSTEGMRTFPPGTDVQTLMTLGFNFDSYAAGYAGVERPIVWYYTTYMKTLYGSATPIS